MFKRGFDLDSSCKLWLPFYKYGNEAQRIYDHSGNGKHATITGAIPSSHVPQFKQCYCVLNGTFTGDTDWVKGTGWAITTVATKTAGVASDLEQNIGATTGTIYYLQYTITRTAGTITPQIGGIDGTARSASGTYLEYITATGTGNLKFQANAAFAGTVDNVKVQVVNGFTGGGWYCDGTDDVFTLSNVFTANQTGLTILSWIYCHAFDQTPGVAKYNAIYYARSANEGYYIRAWHSAANNTKWDFAIFDGATVKSMSPSDVTDAAFNTTYQNKWLCICASFEASTRMKFWINGSAITTDSILAIPASMDAYTGASDYISYEGVSTSYANFTYGEIAIFNRPFSDTELRNYYEITRRRYGV